MRFVLAASVVTACLAASFAGVLPHASVAPTTAWRAHATMLADKQRGSGKPGRSFGDDSCRYANDHECDEPDIGTGACELGTDYSDCRAMRTHEDDSCRYAHDGECDEPHLGSGVCTQGTDHSDCGEVAWLRNRDDSCTTAFNGVCDEPGGHGTGRCARNSDRTDCHGRERPLTISDHFFGRDDRVLVDPSQAPWRAVGTLTLDGGERCTATLIADSVIITAAHCIHPHGSVNANATFATAQGFAGGPYEARVVAYYVHPRFDYNRFNGGNDLDGLDWALLRLDRPLGARVGHVNVVDAIGRDRAHAPSIQLYTAGYPWDTGGHMAGHLGCRLDSASADNTFEHECDTTHGNSGGPLLARENGAYELVGVDSNFRPNPKGRYPYLNIAVTATSFQPYVANFIAGRIGIQMRGGKK